MVFVVRRSCFCLTKMVYHYYISQLIRLSHLSLMSWSRIIASLMIWTLFVSYVMCNVSLLMKCKTQGEIQKKSERKYKVTLRSLPAAWPVRYRPQPSISELKCKHKLALSYHHYSSSIILLSHHDNYLREGGKDQHYHPKLCLCGNIYKTKLNRMLRGHLSPHISFLQLGVKGSRTR